MAHKSDQYFRNNLAGVQYRYMKIAPNAFLNQLHDMMHSHVAVKFVNIGMLYGTFYLNERDVKRDRALGLVPISAPRARLAATEYTLEVLDLISHNLGLPPREVEMLPTLADLGPKVYAPRKKA